MLWENVLLTRFEYQWFNETTKVDIIHIVHFSDSHTTSTYFLLQESQEFIFLKMKSVKCNIDFIIFLEEMWHINSF